MSDDPFGPDPTRARPRPGAGSRTYAGVARTKAGAPLSPDAEPLPMTTRAWLDVGLNPLVRAAGPLLLLAAHVRDKRASTDVTQLRRHTKEEMRRFEEDAASAGVPNEVVLAARYTLCAGLDEAVLSTPWGNQSEWAQHPLLVDLHGEAWGGEKFFDMLDRISADPSRFIDVMELQYLLLAFGFAGKYHLDAQGQERLLEIQQALYRKIRQYRGAPEPALSPRWRGLEDRRNPLIRYIPWWVVGAAALVILAGAFTWYYTALASLAAPVHAELAKVGLEDFSSPPETVPVKGPTLKQLLAPEEQRGVLSVEEQGDQTTITLVKGDLFSSASAVVNPAYQETLRRLTAALNQVPGRVLVVGHTDDQPIRSLRYQDNFELSRERAVSVVALLQEGIDNRARLISNGRGASEPRYRPESDPENRARNRRVEIIHVRGS